MTEMENTEFKLGWEEWLSLPGLGLPALKAKVDTGAKSSALHAYNIEPFGSQTKPKVRFAVNPIPDREDIEVICSADIADKLIVLSGDFQQTSPIGEKSQVPMARKSCAMSSQQPPKWEAANGPWKSH